MGQFIRSHALHLFFLAMPDFILGPDSSPATRNVVGLVKANAALANTAIEGRKIGQRITEEVGGKPIHPVSAVPGGMSFALSNEKRAELETMAKRSVEIAGSPGRWSCSSSRNIRTWSTTWGSCSRTSWA